jgi:hypothetical protein
MKILIGDVVRIDKNGSIPFEGVIYSVGKYYLVPKRDSKVTEDFFTLRIKSVTGSYCIKTLPTLNYEDSSEIEKIGFIENFNPIDGVKGRVIDGSKIQINNSPVVVSRKLMPKTDYSGQGVKIYVKTKKNWFTLVRTTDKMAFYVDGPNESRCGFNSITEITKSV